MVGIRTWTLKVSPRVRWGGGAGEARSEDAGGRGRGVRRLDRGSRTDDPRDGVEGLQPVAGVDHDGLERGVELAGVDELLQHADRGATGGLGEDALGAGEQHDALTDLVVGDVLDGSAGLPAD